jgi:predicted outer membrane protein
LAASRSIRIGGATAALIAVLLAGCAPKRPAPSPIPPVVPARPVPTRAALDPQSYMAFAASSALFAVRASNFAEGRGSTAKIKKYAAQVVMDQTGIGAQLNFAGRRIDLLPSSRLLPRHEAMLEQLATATNFDATYRRQMLQVLTEAELVHRAFEARGSSPTLRPVAAMAGPVCRRNLDQLRKL